MDRKMWRVAVASTDGVTINAHFGSSQEFWIYEVAENGDFCFIERRETSREQEASEGHGRAALAAELLKDTEAVLVAHIGKHAEGLLQNVGIRAYSLDGFDVENALQRYGKRKNFLGKKLE